jgi:hypothetical protein
MSEVTQVAGKNMKRGERMFTVGVRVSMYQQSPILFILDGSGEILPIRDRVRQ